MMLKPDQKIPLLLFLLFATATAGCRFVMEAFPVSTAGVEATQTIETRQLDLVPTPRSGLATPLPPSSEENGWIIYNNEAMGISFEYPAVYEEPAYAACSPRVVEDDNLTLGWRSTLDILDAGGLDLNPFVDRMVQQKGFAVESRRDESVAGLPAVTIDYRFGGTGRFGTLTVLEREGRIYAFNFTAGPTCDAPERQITEMEAYSRMVRSVQFLKTSTTPPAATESAGEQWQTFSSTTLGLSFHFPASWRFVEGDPAGYGKYAGPDGYFITNGMAGGGMSLDEVAQSEASHVLQPFGSSPSIATLEIDGQPARLIQPSTDQQDLAPDMAGMAELIVRFPVPVLTGRSLSEFFVLDADVGHLQEMAGSLSFSRSAELFPAGSETPAAGICDRQEGQNIPLVITGDVPSPRCVRVRPDQLAEVTNGTGMEVRFKLAWYELALQPGETYTFDVPFGVFLAPGVHHLQLNRGNAPEIWLETTRPSVDLNLQDALDF